MAGPSQPYYSFTSDEITVLLDDTSGNDSVKSDYASAESDIGYTQDKSEPAEEEEEIEPVTVTFSGCVMIQM
jgi:hypothetical protein